jgi:hypothetical protein
LTEGLWFSNLSILLYILLSESLLKRLSIQYV